MRSNNSLGEFEHLLLLCLVQLSGHSYGTAIRNKLKDAIGRDSSIGALYATLERLEKKGFVSSSIGEPTPQRGGRAKRYFTLTTQGKRVLSNAKRNLDILWEGVEP